jgi:hypothetical protein
MCFGKSDFDIVGEQYACLSVKVTLANTCGVVFCQQCFVAMALVREGGGLGRLQGISEPGLGVQQGDVREYKWYMDG